MARLSEYERFWSKVRPGVGEACWDWIGTRTRGGYGVFMPTKSRIAVYAHRYMFELHNGALPARDDYHGSCVLHVCDNPGCVRPDHLRLGTHADNMADMVRKNRHYVKEGEGHPFSKLNDEKVLEIRRLKDSGHRAVDLAQRFGVSRAQINNVVSGHSWGHVGRKSH